MKIRIPVFQQNSLNERILRSGLVSQLRATPFTTGLISGTEMTIANGYSQNNYGYYEFEITGADLTKLLKLYVSADNVTFEQITTWGGTDGIRQKEYRLISGLISQSGTSNPTIVYSANEAIGTLSIERDIPGQYNLSSTFGSEFTSNKTLCLLSPTPASSTSKVSILPAGATIVQFLSADISGNFQDDVFNSNTFEIKIYP